MEVTGGIAFHLFSLVASALSLMSAPQDGVLNKVGDKIWQAVTCGEDGQVKKILEQYEDILWTLGNAAHDDDSVSSIRSISNEDEETAGPASNQADIKSALVTAVGMAMKPNDILNRLANTTRYLTVDQAVTLGGPDRHFGLCSILFIAVCRKHKEDLEYLVQNFDIDLKAQNSRKHRTPFHEALCRGECQLMHTILRSPAMSPSQYVNVGDRYGWRPLHSLMTVTEFHGNPQGQNNGLEILRTLLRSGANIDALDKDFRTPLHCLISSHPKIKAPSLLKHLLAQGAEVNSKDVNGQTPLHLSCQKRQRETIGLLLDYGADLESLDVFWQTPRQIYEKSGEMTKVDRFFVAWRLSSLHNLVPVSRKGSKGSNQPKEKVKCPSNAKYICQQFPVNIRYQWAWMYLRPTNFTTVSWVPDDLEVLKVVYSDSTSDENSEEVDEMKEPKSSLDFYRDTFIETFWDGWVMKQSAIPDQGCENSQIQSLNITEDLLKKNIKERAWRWINFPSNNMTWVKDFIVNNCESSTKPEVDPQTWSFFRSSIKVRETDNLSLRVRRHHVMAKARTEPDDASHQSIKETQTRKPVDVTQQKAAKKSELSGFEFKAEEPWTTASCCVNPSSMISLVIPFLDIETDDVIDNKFLNIRAEDLTTFKSFNKNGTFRDRWCKRKAEESLRREEQQNRREFQAFLLDIDKPSKLRRFMEMLLPPLFKRSQQANQRLMQTPGFLGKDPKSWPDAVNDERSGGKDANAANAEKVRQDKSRKWLVIRQVWLWKLDDNTVLTAIPSRNNNAIMADNLLETIRQGDLDILRTSNDLIKRIVFEAVTFPDEFKWAGLGVHVLDVFEDEIVARANKEEKFFQDFIDPGWNAEAVNKNITDAAKCSWLVRDIRYELRLLRQLFEQQLNVVEEFAKLMWPPKDSKNSQGLTKETRKSLRENFIRDCGLESLIQRVDRLDKDASATLEGLSNIIQALQAQGSLKEAEAARDMNLMILPFTIVTVIFTPLSFMTSLFAINLDNFPHNSDEELSIPSSWLNRRMWMGELSVIYAMFLILLVIYYWQSIIKFIRRKFVPNSKSETFPPAARSFKERRRA